MQYPSEMTIIIFNSEAALVSLNRSAEEATIFIVRIDDLLTSLKTYVSVPYFIFIKQINQY